MPPKKNTNAGFNVFFFAKNGVVTQNDKPANFKSQKKHPIFLQYKKISSLSTDFILHRLSTRKEKRSREKENLRLSFSLVNRELAKKRQHQKRTAAKKCPRQKIGNFPKDRQKRFLFLQESFRTNGKVQNIQS